MSLHHDESQSHDELISDPADRATANRAAGPGPEENDDLLTPEEELEQARHIVTQGAEAGFDAERIEEAYMTIEASRGALAGSPDTLPCYDCTRAAGRDVMNERRHADPARGRRARPRGQSRRPDAELQAGLRPHGDLMAAVQIEHPFEIRTEFGDHAYADDEAAAMAAARTLRKDYRNGGMVPREPAVYIIFEGECVLTIDSKRRIG